VDNSIATGPNVQGLAGVLTESGGTISRLNDFRPEDIERIEVIRGPAAATLYGTEASNGVIQIITKKGRPGETQFGVTVRQGTSWFKDAEDRLWQNWGLHPDTGEPYRLNLIETERALGNELFKRGSVQGYDVNLRGGTDRATYFLSAGLDRETGVEPTNKMWRFATRMNVSVHPRDDFDADVSVGYVTGRTDLSREAARAGMTFSMLQSNPSDVNGPSRGFGVGLPEDWYSPSGGGRSFQDLGRTTLGIQLRHRPTTWLSHRLAVGFDAVNEDNQFIQERTPPGEVVIGTPEGTKALTRRDVSTGTVDYSASVPVAISSSLVATTTVGAQYYRRLTEFVSVDGTGFPVTGVGVTAAAGATTGSDAFVENNTLGLFVQEQIALNDRIFVTGAVRADDNSAFGREFDLVYYPKISGTWVVNEEPFWSVPWVDALKLRTAFGAAGQQPQDFAALRSYQPVTSGSGEATLTPQFVGNDRLAPERGQEWEVGFEAGLFNSRLGIDFTYYSARTTDAILLRGIAPSLGFPGTQFVNAGEIANRGLELQIRALVVESDNLSVDATLNLATNTTEIKDLGGVDQGAGIIPAHPFIPVIFHAVGFSPSSTFDRHVVAADLDADGTAINVMCDSGNPNGRTLPDGTPLEWGGSAVPCDEAPRLYNGRPTPTFEGSFSLQATMFRRLRFLTMIDWKAGHKISNGADLGRCSVRQVCEENFFPERFDPITIAGIQSGFFLTEWVSRDGKFAKLREVSLSYDFPDAWASFLGADRLSMTLAGRNLHTWTGFGGVDPEGFYYSDIGPALNVQNHIPPLAQVVWSMSVGF
jgi:TonB-dependent SusC/RagA subfamily outer membrane receptor